MKLHKSSVVIFAIILLLFTYAGAVDLHPDLKARLKREGKFKEYLSDLDRLHSRGVDMPSSRSLLKSIALGSGPDTVRAVVLMAEFSDNPASGDLVDNVDSAYFDQLLNSEGELPYGSMREFYDENSRGQFVFIADVFGWYMMPETYAFYVDGQKGFGDFPMNAQGLVYDAIFEADSDVDYSLYDNNGNGYVDALIVVHAGPGFEVSGDVNQIHSHKWALPTSPIDWRAYADGVALWEYNIDPEENSVQFPEPIRIGVFCHEFGHTLGLPDLYDTDFSSTGVGDWSLMASGNYNGGSQSPAHLDAWSKVRLGWIVPENITSNEQDHEFPQVQTSGYVARLWTDGSMEFSDKEYYLIENRQKTGFDSYLPGEGLLIWHIDDTHWGNDNEYQYNVALEQADGLFQLEEGQGDGDANDPYPGNLNVREFSEVTVPASFTNDGDSTFVAVWNISDSDSIMTANLDINFSRPRFELIDYFVEEISGNGDEIIENGETWGLNLRIVNVRADGINVSVYAEIDDPSITINPSVQLLGDIPSLDSIDNYSSPINFVIPAENDASIAIISFMVRDQAGTDSLSASLQLNIGVPQILLVSSDGEYHDYEYFYTDIFDSLKIPYQIYNRDTLPTPENGFLNFPKIVWYSSFDSLEHSDVEFLTEYLYTGGKLFLTGQNIAEYLSTNTDSLFLKNYLKVRYKSSSMFNDKSYGIDGSYIGRSGFILLTNSADGAANQNSRDNLMNVNSSALPSFSYSNIPEEDNIAGIEYNGSYRLVFWGFGFEAIVSDRPDFFNTRFEVMQRILNFLDDIATNVDDDPDVASLPTHFTLNQNYPNPFNPRTVISYELNRNIDGDVSLRIYNILGCEVKSLMGLPRGAGAYSFEWKGLDNSENQVSSGVYFYRLQAGDETQARKMILLK